MNEKIENRLDELKIMMENFAKEQPESHKAFEYLYQVKRVMKLYGDLDECVARGKDESEIEMAIERVENAIKAYLFNK